MNTLLRRISSHQYSTLSNLSKITKRSLNSFNSHKDSLDLPLTNGIHVFQCPDAVGIVAKLSECIASRGGNILCADIFAPANKQIFYSRSEFIFDPSKWSREQMDEDFLKIGSQFGAMNSVVCVPDLDPKYKIAVFASKLDHCLVDLLHAWQDKRLPVDITCVISNHNRNPDSHAMRFLERHKVPYHFLDTSAVNKREEEILSLVQDTDFLVLARYMQAFDCGVKMIGATSHFVTEELDAGPIIEQMVERVSHRDNLQSFVQRSENLEKQCLSKAIKYYCELRVLPYLENKTVVF